MVRIRAAHRGLHQTLPYEMDDEWLDQVHQVPEVKLTVPLHRTQKRPEVSGSKSAWEVLRRFFQEEMELRESFRVLLLDRGNRAKGVFTVSVGGLHNVPVDVRVVFCSAIKCLANSIVIAHNHPSGLLKPSREDIDLTLRIVEAGKLLDVQVVDHLILTTEGYFSFHDHHLL